MNNSIMWIATIIFAVFCITIAFNAGNKATYVPPPNTYTKTEPITMPPIYVSASALYNEYKENAVSADMKYKGRIVVVTGIVDSINKNFIDESPYITLGSGGEYDIKTVNCYFGSNDLDTLANISKGSTISIQGTGRGGNLMTPMLDNCSVK